ncbi:uncharacterized protein BDZ99DRAFT_467309 [Mytilinidion resinicola]|uniref:Uncharacterized protein n=1 Tax=Mytilinidion resinicola TaxID=574789 RepID=A0A6A6Y7F3_9PEZI|nr:uncharacterized protein BDZ99DRAFT_467309 [Mytilinidion resinicola]KAF2804620.1 hypothetical protein BDZ99DRAFT_467309 [Mytilinidion resinicola]
MTTLSEHLHNHNASPSECTNEPVNNSGHEDSTTGGGGSSGGGGGGGQGTGTSPPDEK